MIGSVDRKPKGIHEGILDRVYVAWLPTRKKVYNDVVAHDRKSNVL